MILDPSHVRMTTGWRGRALLVLLVLLPVAVAVAGCRNAAPAPAIGIAMGEDGVAAARLAAADVNAAGGIDGDSLVLRVGDVEADAIRLADSLAGDSRVVAVVGHSSSAASLAASQIYNARGVTQLAPTTTAVLFSSAGPYSFRLVPDDRRQAAFLADQVARAGARRLALVYVNDDYGRALQSAVRAHLDRRGTPVVYEAPYLEKTDTAQLASVARALAAARPDLLLWLGRPVQLRLVLATPRPALPDLPVLGSDGVDFRSIYERPDQYPRVRFVRFVDPAGAGEALRAFRARFVATAGHEPPAEATLTYDATMLVATAMRGGARTREAVRAYLTTVGIDRPAYHGISGAIAFDRAGDVTRPHLLAEARADGVQPVAVP